MPVSISHDFQTPLRVADTEQIDTFDDFTGNLKDLLKFERTNEDGQVIPDGSLIWLVQLGELEDGGVSIPFIGYVTAEPVADDSKLLSDGSKSTHRVDSDYGSVYYHAASGLFAFVVDAQAVNALLTLPRMVNLPDENWFFVAFRVTVETIDGVNNEMGVRGFYLQITQAVDDIPRLQTVPQAYNSEYVEVVIQPKNLTITDHDTSEKDILVRLMQVSAYGRLLRDGVELLAGDGFSYQDLRDGLVVFVFDPAYDVFGVWLNFQVFDGINEAGQSVGLELIQRLPYQPVDVFSSNDIDLSTERFGRIINTGDGRDIIIGTQGEDEIEAGLGNDIIDLGDGATQTSSDEVVYRFDSSGKAIDGGDTIDNILFGGPSRDGIDTLMGGAGADIFVARLSDAGFGQNGDVVSDFTDGVDFIGLSDIDVEALSWADASSSEAGARTRIYEASSDTTLFFLENIAVSQIDASDFIQTDFV